MTETKCNICSGSSQDERVFFKKDYPELAMYFASYDCVCGYCFDGIKLMRKRDLIEQKSNLRNWLNVDTNRKRKVKNRL